jgi:hypothetical protein
MTKVTIPGLRRAAQALKDKGMRVTRGALAQQMGTSHGSVSRALRIMPSLAEELGVTSEQTPTRPSQKSAEMVRRFLNKPTPTLDWLEVRIQERERSRDKKGAT